MKKTLLFLASIFCAAQISAQTADDASFVVLDENENVVSVLEDGATYVGKTLVSNELTGDEYITSGISVKSNTESGRSWVSIKYEVLSMDNGAFQCCFGTCSLNSALGTYYSPANGSYQSIAAQSLADEWFFASKSGEAVVKYTIIISSDKAGSNVIEGKTLTVTYTTNASALPEVTAEDIVKTEYYSLTGAKVEGNIRGFVIRVDYLTDGTKRTSRALVR